MRPARRRSRRLDAAFAIVVLLGVAFLVEGALALAGDPVGPVFNLKKGIRWTLEANLHDKPFKMVESSRFFKVTTNADGVRGDATQGPVEGRSTLLLLGDSTIFGWGVDDGEDVPSQLEGALRARGAAVRVVNGGQPGFSSLQSFLFLREVGVRYAPDLVLLEFTLHNFRRAPQPDSRVIDASGSSQADYWLAAHSRTYRALRKLLVLASARPDAEIRGGEIVGIGDPDREAVDVRVPPADFYTTLQGAAALGRREGFQFAVSFPPRNANNLPEPYKDAARALADAGELVVVDYTRAWDREGGSQPDTWLADDPGHYSVTGAARTARALADQLVADGLVR